MPADPASKDLTQFVVAFTVISPTASFVKAKGMDIHWKIKKSELMLSFSVQFFKTNNVVS